MIHMRNYIKDTHATVDNNIAKSIIKGVCSLLDVKGKLALTKDGRAYANKHWNTGNVANSKDGGFPLVITSSYSEEYSKGSLVNGSTNKPNSKSIFRDVKNNIIIDVASIGLVTLLEMEFHSKSDNLISAIENRLRLMRIDNTDVIELRAIFKYFMTEDAYNLVTLGCKGENIEDYMAVNTDKRFTLISTIDGSRSQYGFKTEALIQVAITSDTAVIKSIYDKDSGMYTYVLSLRYMYERPTYMDLSYDYTINGHIIPSSMLPKDREIRLITDLKCVRELMDHNSVLDYVYGNVNGTYYIRIPDFDRHTDILTYSPYTTIFSVLLEENPDGSNVLFNLNRLNDLELSEVVLEFLRLERDNLLGDCASIFKLSVFCGTTELHDMGITVDEELNVIANRDPNCSGSIRVLFEIINDASYLCRKAFLRLLDLDVFNLLKDFGVLENPTDERSISFRLNLPERLKPEYVIAYSDMIVKFIKKV